MANTKIVPIFDPEMCIIASMTERYINPYTDFGFKKLFGTEMNKDLLISFLNALLDAGSEKIDDIHYLNNENLGDGYDKYSEAERRQHERIQNSSSNNCTIHRLNATRDRKHLTYFN